MYVLSPTPSQRPHGSLAPHIYCSIPSLFARSGSRAYTRIVVLAMLQAQPRVPFDDSVSASTMTVTSEPPTGPGPMQPTRAMIHIPEVGI